MPIQRARQSEFRKYLPSLVLLLSGVVAPFLWPVLNDSWKALGGTDPPKSLEGVFPKMLAALSLLVLSFVFWVRARTESFPASKRSKRRADAIDPLDRRDMLDLVRSDCTEAFERSLCRIAKIDLALESRQSLVESERIVARMPKSPPAILPQGTKISQVFDSHGKELLILGDPGTGKTTLLLELAGELLDRADRDENQPMPVIFNLSTWSLRRDPLDQWLVSELIENYRVPRDDAQSWIEQKQIIPLLDGLDEVSARDRPACAEAINEFRGRFKFLPVLVCCRTSDYDELGTKLRLRAAVIVQALTEGQVADYISRHEELQSLLPVLKEDHELEQLLRTPLMLWVAVMAFSGTDRKPLSPGSPTERRHELFARYVHTMIERRPDARYQPKQMVQWLSWLAAIMDQGRQTVFNLEDLNEGWLPHRIQRWLVKSALVLGATLLSGLLAAFAYLGYWPAHIIRYGDKIPLTFSYFLFLFSHPYLVYFAGLLI